MNEKNIKKSIRLNFNNLSKKFKNGLDEKNLRQGVFKNVYIENNQKENSILPKDTCKLLCESIFNYKISDALMVASDKPIFNYKIVECRFEYFDKRIEFYYHISDGRSHDFWQNYTIFNIKNPMSGFDHPMYDCLYINDFIENFKN